MSATLCAPPPARAYFIEWQGPATGVTTSVFDCSLSCIDGIDTHTVNGFVGINDLLFLESETTTTVFEGPADTFRLAWYTDQITREFVVRRSTAGELPVTQVRLSGALGVDLFGIPEFFETTGGDLDVANAFVHATVIGTGLGVERLFFGSFFEEPSVHARENFDDVEFLAVDVPYTLRLKLDTIAARTWDGETARFAHSEAFIGARVTPVSQPDTLTLITVALACLGLTFLRGPRGVFGRG